MEHDSANRKEVASLNAANLSLSSGKTIELL